MQDDAPENSKLKQFRSAMRRVVALALATVGVLFTFSFAAPAEHVVLICTKEIERVVGGF